MLIGATIAIILATLGASTAGSYSFTSVPGYCDTAGVPTSKILGGVARLDDLLKRRVIACRDAIALVLTPFNPTPRPPWAFPTPTPNARFTPFPPTIPIDCREPWQRKTLQQQEAGLPNDPNALSAILAQCVGYLTVAKALPTATPSPTPLPYIASHPTFYVFATGAMAADWTSYTLIRSSVERLTVNYLEQFKRTPSPGTLEPPTDLQIIARPDWTTLSSFASQCQLDPMTRGALVLEGPIPQTVTNAWLLFTNTHQYVSAGAELFGCSPFDHDPSVSPLSLAYQSNVSGYDTETTFPFGILASIGSLFAQNKTTTSTVTTASVPKSVTHPTAAPTTVTTTTTNTNLNWPLVLGTAASTLATQNIPAINPNAQLNAASFDLIDKLLSKLLYRACEDPMILKAAAAAGDPAHPTPVPQNRAVAYRAAYEFIYLNCDTFDNFSNVGLQDPAITNTLQGK
jgi:hypothetical protein